MLGKLFLLSDYLCFMTQARCVLCHLKVNFNLNQLKAKLIWKNHSQCWLFPNLLKDVCTSLVSHLSSPRGHKAAGLSQPPN